MSKHNVDKICELKCENCNKEYKISRVNYNQRKRKNRPILCPECAKNRGIELRKENNAKKPIEEKEKINQKISNTLKQRNAETKQPETIKLVCDNCHEEYEISRNTYRSRIRNNRPNLCSDCMKINTSKILSENRINTWNNLSSEEQQKQVDRLFNISEEKKIAKNKKSSETRKINYANKSDEEKEEYANVRRLGWLNKPESEKEEFRQKQQQIWNDKSEEEKINQINNLHNLTEEQENARRLKISIKHKLRYEDPKEHDRTSEAVIKGQSNMSIEDKNKMRKKQLASSQGKNELHRKFESLFNDLGLAKYFYLDDEISISINNVSHFWDYGIYDQNNDLQLLIDLDGEFFHADNNYDYDGLFSHEEYDEIRYLCIPDNVKSCIIYENNFEESFDYLIKILKESYDEYLQSKYEYCNSIQFPFPEYNTNELIYSYNQLCKLDCNDKYHKDNLSVNTRLGDHLIYHFHPTIFRERINNNKLSPYEIWNNDEILYDLIKNNNIIHNYLNFNKLYQSFNIDYKLRFISAARSKLIINKYLNEYDIIFNPLDKFSGIMLGSISLNKKYIGFNYDSNILNESLNLVMFLRKHFKDINVDLQYKDIFNSFGNYSCLFTSLPNNSDELINECLQRFDCTKYIFITNNTKKYKDNIVEEIKNKNYSNEYIIKIEK